MDLFIFYMQENPTKEFQPTGAYKASREGRWGDGEKCLFWVNPQQKIPQGGWGEGFEAYARLRGVMFELSRFYYTKQVHLFIFLNEKLKKR